ncbi:MAG: energy transducer TonB [bacterium]
MSPLPGQPLFVEGRYHVFGARHPLQRDAARLIVRSAVISLLLIAAVFVATYVPSLFKKSAGEEAGEVTISREIRTEIPQAPSVSQGPSGPVVPGFKPGGRPPTAALGIPDPVPDLQAEAPTIASQQEMGMPIDPNGIEGLGGGGGGGWGATAVLDNMPTGPIDSLLSPDAFVAYDKSPELVRPPVPKYPKLAREANIEGEVRLRVLVGEDGKVRKVLIVSGPESLQDAAAKAMAGAVFKPALNGNRPVAVWIAQPVNFSLD